MLGGVKISVIGAGNVGATIAHGLLNKGLGHVVLLDVAEDMAKGKALDLLQAGPIEGYSTSVTGTSRYEDTMNSDIVVITAGIARKPGMTREDLVVTNATVVRDIVKQVSATSPNAHLILVTNPLDVMCYVALEASGFPPQRVFGQSGVLDSSRFRTFLAMELGIAVEDISACVLGGHGDEMVPLIRYTFVGGIPVERLLAQDRLQEIVARTQKGGAEIVSLLRAGSAYYAPAAATVRLVEAVVYDKKQISPTSVYLQGEYGVRDLYLGVPAIIGCRGIERVIELDLNDDEYTSLMRSAALVRKSLAVARDSLKNRT